MIVVPIEADHNFSYVFVITSLLPHEFFCITVTKDFVDVVHDL